MINETLESAGFAYDPKKDIFYSTMDCWQRKMGYCKLFDKGSPLFNMVIDCEPIPFFIRRQTMADRIVERAIWHYNRS